LSLRVITKNTKGSHQYIKQYMAATFHLTKVENKSQ